MAGLIAQAKMLMK